jgi:hypothetical protein
MKLRTYQTIAITIITALIVTVIVLSSCEKVEKYNYVCDAFSVRYYHNAKCPDTVFRKIYHYDITEDQFSYWIRTFETQEYQSFQGDTVIIKNYIKECGMTICN